VCALGEAGDLDRAADLLADAYWNDDMPREAVRRAHLGSSAWVGARDEEGRLVATARAAGDVGKRVWVYDVMVAPDWRGVGLGEAVVRLLLDHPAVRHARRVYLRTRDAQPFYARMGFEDRLEAEARQLAGSRLAERPWPATDMVLLRAP
jgi:GNAT superfamily N-acetyltransferase